MKHASVLEVIKEVILYKTIFQQMCYAYFFRE